MRVVTANVNGIRAYARKGGLTELARHTPTVITVQEVRASSLQLAEALADSGFAHWSCVHEPAEQLGRNGVAVASAEPITAVRMGLPAFEGHGRWIEADTTAAGEPVSVVSAYVPKGSTEDPVLRQRKLDFLTAMSDRMAQLLAGGADVLITGDLNVARADVDLRNWKQRVGKSGFLPEERAELAGWEAAGWRDLGRDLGGPGPGPYTWWSQRGRAFDNDVGWRIDYVWATPALAARAVSATVLKAPTWDTRWSDHAAVLVQFSA